MLNLYHLLIYLLGDLMCYYLLIKKSIYLYYSNYYMLNYFSIKFSYEQCVLKQHEKEETLSV
jgi:hypothetical protein